MALPRSRTLVRAAAVAAVATTSLGALAGGAGGDEPRKVKAPKSGSQYSGNHDMTILISGKSIELLAFDFPCGETEGRTSLNGVPLEKTKRGYKFSTATHGNASYDDGHADENASVGVSGRFTRDAKKVRGRFAVYTPYCGGTGKIKWRATR
jgi:hypothetical protein